MHSDDAATTAAQASSPLSSDDADHSARVQGQFYTTYLANLHETLRPATYLEIGTFAGDTLRLANCATIAVDPHFQVGVDVIGQKPMCLLFQQTSDGFFSNHSPRELFGDAVDMAFLDGLHRFECVLRDFINSEKHCRRTSIVILHDCLPPGFYMTVRAARDPVRKKSRFGDWWTGDVWKIVPVLQKFRPDLSITLLDCAPTGLVIVSNLDPNNTILERRYTDIIDAYSRPEINRASYDAYWQRVDVQPCAELMSLQQLTTRLSLFAAGSHAASVPTSPLSGDGRAKVSGA